MPLLSIHPAAAASEGQKREYVKWTPEEESVFYEALRDVAGQKPEACCKEVCQRLRGSKAYAQVCLPGCLCGGAGDTGRRALGRAAALPTVADAHVCHGSTPVVAIRARHHLPPHPTHPPWH